MSALFALLLSLLTASARAEACAPNAASRLAYIESGMAAAAHASKVWSRAWGGLWIAATATQGILAARANQHGDRVDFAVGAGASVFGLLPTLIISPMIIDDYARLMDISGPSDTCSRLAVAERMLQESAANEQQGRAWVSHLGNVLFNVGVGMILGAGYGRWPSATLSMAVGIPIGELMIFTQPHRSDELLRRYQLAVVPGNDAYELRLGLAF